MASKLYGVDATIIIFVFILYFIVCDFTIPTEIFSFLQHTLQQGKFVLDKDVPNVKSIEITFIPENPSMPIRVESISVHACGEPTTTGATGASE